MNTVDNQDSSGKGRDGEVTCRPFIKWVGGKTQLLPALLKRLPVRFNRYFEPFIGGGALYFARQPAISTISDLNGELVNLYTCVKCDVHSLIEELASYTYDERAFYAIRDADRDPEYLSWSPVRRAARFIYLNKTCYNGLYRVNSKGQFNTPFGRYTNPRILDALNLRRCCQALAGAEIRRGSFLEIEERVKRGDFVYFDPPYVPLSGTSSFTAYQQGGFGPDLQQQLFDLCCRLDERGVKFMLSNSSAPVVLEMYRTFNVEFVPANRAINSKGGKRGAIDEVIVRNYG